MDDRDRQNLRSLSDEAVDAVMMQITQVAEDARRVSDGTLGTIPGVPWRQVKGIRDKIVHDYGFVDAEIVRDLVDHSLSELIDAVERALA